MAATRKGRSQSLRRRPGRERQVLGRSSFRGRNKCGRLALDGGYSLGLHSVPGLRAASDFRSGLGGWTGFGYRLAFGDLGFCLGEFLYVHAEVPAQLVGDIVL
jgi:hypothetical protein